MPSDHKTLAIVCSDIHLSHRPPLARSNEADWYEVMRDRLRLLRQHCGRARAPLIIAGDVFDKWNPPPKLINFAIQEFKAFPYNVYAIPGQHDLPDHDLGRMHESAYGSLRYAEAIIHLAERTLICADNGTSRTSSLFATPFQWGQELEPCEADAVDGVVHCAIIHKYVWMKGHGYPGAPVEASAKQTAKQLTGYHVAVFGDNHKSFMAADGKLDILNCGALLKRKSDERDYRTSIGFITDQGTVLRKELKNRRKEEWLDIPDLPTTEENIELQLLLRELANIGDAAINFEETVHAALEGHRPSVRKLVLSILDSKS
jgi:DNA repair exonuclease SbcCD nuclease subunit